MYNDHSRAGCIIAAQLVSISNPTGRQSWALSRTRWTQSRGSPLDVTGTAQHESREASARACGR